MQIDRKGRRWKDDVCSHTCKIICRGGTYRSGCRRRPGCESRAGAWLFRGRALDSIVPISKMRKLVEERTGADEFNKIFKLNPKVDDIPDTYSEDLQRRQASAFWARSRPAEAAVSARSM